MKTTAGGCSTSLQQLAPPVGYDTKEASHLVYFGVNSLWATRRFGTEIDYDIIFRINQGFNGGETMGDV